MSVDDAAPPAEAPDRWAETWPDLAGRLSTLDGVERHTLAIRVYYEDTDAGGIAYHGSYVRWCERGRSDYLRLLGTDARRMISGDGGLEPAGFIVRKMTFDFFKPARMDDVLEIETCVLEIGGASLKLRQVISRDRVRVAEADVVLVLISTSGRPLRIDDLMRERFQRSTPIIAPQPSN